MGHARSLARFALVAAALLAPFWFPLSFTLLTTLVGAIASPWVPLMVGIALDTLSWSHGAYPYPLYTLIGALGTFAAFFVHRFVETSIMRS